MLETKAARLGQPLPPRLLQATALLFALLSATVPHHRSPPTETAA